VVDRFEGAYGMALDEAYRILKSGGRLFLMVGRPVVRGEIVDLPEMSRRLATRVGFESLAEAERVGSNRRANKMGGESLLFFSKT
jgi:predicted methyltransferase